VAVTTGFFITLVLAWYHGEKGRQRVSGPEVLMLAALLVVAGVALSVLPGAERVAGPVRLGSFGEVGDGRPSIAVLPIDNLSPDGTYSFFAHGVQEELTSKLSHISSIAVKARSSVGQYRDPASRPPVREIAAALGVDFVIEGSARITNDSVRITVQLIDAQTENHLWAENFDAPYSAEDYYRLQARIAQEITYALRTPISSEENEWLEAIPTGNIEALESYLRGLEAYREERLSGLEVPEFTSTRLFAQAIELDPRFGIAHAYLALSLTPSSAEGRWERARRAAERALSLAGEVPEARLVLARYWAGVDDEEAARQLEAALESAPDNTAILRSRATTQEHTGDHAAAIRTLVRAEQLDPRDPLLPQALGDVFISLHRWDDALDAFARWVAISEEPPTSEMRRRAFIHLARGEHERARAAISEWFHSNTSGAYRFNVGMTQAVIRRFMTPEDRRVSLESWIEAVKPIYGEDISCAANTYVCVRRAIHEQEVGSDAEAQVLWDSLKVAFESAAPPTVAEGYRINALVHMEVGEKELALEWARSGVELYSPAGCRSSRYVAEMCTMLARVLARFGEYDEAIDLVEEMLPAPSWFTVHLLEIDPIWDPLRDHPRFQALLEMYADDVEH
jgi:serine/threonine-protein kinase